MDLIYSDDCSQVWCGDSTRSQLPSCRALITDPPYSERTHNGQSDLRAGFAYDHWTADDVYRALAVWHKICLGWIAVMTDHILQPSWIDAFNDSGRYVFQPLPCVITGGAPRMCADGPPSDAVYAIVARPRSRDFVGTWSGLKGHYGPLPRDHASKVKGGKPLWLMRSLVEDYSRVGDTILDPCCGGGTTLVAAKELGRYAIGIDIDRSHAEISAQRLRETRQLPMPIKVERPVQLEIGGDE